MGYTDVFYTFHLFYLFYLFIHLFLFTTLYFVFILVQYYMLYCFSVYFLSYDCYLPSFSFILVLFLLSLLPFLFFCSLPSFSFILVNFLPSSFLLFLFSPSSLLLYSPVVSEGQYNKIWSYIDEARDLGYKFLYGGDRQLVSVDSGNVIREKVSYQLYSLSSLVFLIPFL